MILLFLSACGVDGPLDQPLPPPTPPPMLVADRPDSVELAGVVSEVHAPTRSFILAGEGKRVIAHVLQVGTLHLGGKAATVAELANGTTLYVDGSRQGDLLLVLRASDVPEDAPVVPVPVVTEPVVDPAAPVEPVAPVAPAGEAAAPE